MQARGEIKVRKLVAIGGCLTALACAPAALAGSPSTDAYTTSGEQVQSALTAAPIKLQTGPGGGSQLPMTGMDLSVIGAAGIGLAGMGFALRRLAGKQEKD